jgi:hypothetical protein
VVGWLLRFLTTLAYRELQDCDRPPLAGRESEGAWRVSGGAGASASGSVVGQTSPGSAVPCPARKTHPWSSQPKIAFHDHVQGQETLADRAAEAPAAGHPGVATRRRGCKAVGARVFSLSTKREQTRSFQPEAGTEEEAAWQGQRGCS